jgi:hypothetical protein
MQARIDVHDLAIRIWTVTGRDRRVDERSHRHAALLRETEQQPELLRVVCAGNHDNDLARALPVSLPERLELCERELGRGLPDGRARDRLEAELGPVSMADLARLEPCLTARLVTGHDPVTLDEREAGLRGANARLVGESQCRVVDVDDERCHDLRRGSAPLRRACAARGCDRRRSAYRRRAVPGGAAAGARGTSRRSR